MQAGAAGDVLHADTVDAVVAELRRGRVDDPVCLRAAFDVGRELVDIEGGGRPPGAAHVQPLVALRPVVD